MQMLCSSSEDNCCQNKHTPKQMYQSGGCECGTRLQVLFGVISPCFFELGNSSPFLKKNN